MLNMILFATVAIIGGAICTDRALKQNEKLIKEGEWN